MSQFIRCPTCAFYFGPYMEFFDIARQAIYEEELKKNEYNELNSKFNKK